MLTSKTRSKSTFHSAGNQIDSKLLMTKMKKNCLIKYLFKYRISYSQSSFSKTLSMILQISLRSLGEIKNFKARVCMLNKSSASIEITILGTMFTTEIS